MSASDLLKAHDKEIKRLENSLSISTSASPTQNNRQNTPMLGRGISPGSDIFFDESPNIKKRKSSDADRAKVSTLQFVLFVFNHGEIFNTSVAKPKLRNYAIKKCKQTMN